MALFNKLSAGADAKSTSEYNSQMLEQYKLYVTLTDRAIDRRQRLNSFYLSLNSALIALISYLYAAGNNETISPQVWMLLASGGLLFCCCWQKTICSHRNLNQIKFDLIIEIEQKLPINLYSTEWKKAKCGKDPKIYTLATKLEEKVPCAFALTYGLIFIIAVCAVLGLNPSYLSEVFCAVVN